MLLSLLAALIARVLGPLDRATRLDLDDRHTLPGWPVGLAPRAAKPIV